jgi:diguanylate cyclase (GGDEF)-like protein/PAS domain S-box-containing protein
MPRGEDVLTHDQHQHGPAELAEAVFRVRPAWPDFRAVFDRSPVGMAVLDGTGRVLDANRAMSEFLGLDATDLVGRPLHDFAAADDVGRFRVGVGERRLRHTRGHDLWAVVSAVALPEAGDRALLVCLDDATGRRNTERMLLHAALHDSLTNLPNRRLLRDRLETALARAHRSASTVAVLFIDLDRFKDVNDTLGHDAGDEVLVGVANGIYSALRSCDTVARLGGDEFVVVCEDVNDDNDVTRLADRLLAGIRRPVHVRSHTVSVTASIGIAIAGPRAGSGDELLRLADLAMYRAKTRSDTPYFIADESVATGLDVGPRAGQELLAELRHAIQADKLQLHYQPVVRVDGSLIGLEALVRWPHPRLGLLLPHDFLPRVAGSDLARPLSDWVLRTAVRDAASWHDPGLRVSVNVWACEVARPGFADTVAMLLTWAGLQARGLYLEMHEHDLPSAGPGLSDELDRLRRLGVGLAIDDYGTGGTSLAGLRRLPVDTLKVDRSFVAGCLDDPEDSAVVAAVATAARAAGRHPLAAGVETFEQLKLLRDLGYESIQGYLSGAPAPLIDLRDLISHRRVPLG